MRILQIIPYFYPATNIGGTASIVYETSKFLVENGHKVTVYTTDVGDGTKRLDVVSNRKISVDGIDVIYFKNIINSLAFINHLYLPPKYFGESYKDIKNFDIIHLHEVYTLMHVWAAILINNYKIPYVISAHGTVNLVREAGRIKRKRLFNLFFGRRMLADAMKVIALTAYEKSVYRQMNVPLEKIAVIPNGINVDEFSNLPPKSVFRDKYKIKNNIRILLYMGRVHPKKGIELLIKAIKILIKIRKDLLLVISGPVEDKNYYNCLRDLISKFKLEKDILILDALSHQEKLSAFVAADIFVLTSYGEGLPISLLEAAASGLPLLISKGCNLPQVEKYHAGKVVDSTVDSIVSGIKKIIAKENFDLESTAKKVEELYKEVILNYEK
jgi:glycosyltransferase involved in cell wall biosynthesis